MKETSPDPLAVRCGEVSWKSVFENRRSYRFGRGMEIPGGPLAFRSRFLPEPLTEEEEAALVFAAAGFTGPVMADLDYSAGGGGGIMVGARGRTIPSGDGIQTVGLLVTNDRATYWIRRPQDFSGAEYAELVALGMAGAWTEFYRRVRVRLLDRRAAPSKEPLFNLAVNRWSSQAAGTTCFVPVNDVTLMYVNGLLEIFNEATGAYVLDERRSYLPAGLGRWAASRGGHLRDDAKDARLATVRHVEQMVTEFVTVEQGMMIQNLALMSEALGLGGYPNFANHEFGWFEAAGFTMRRMSASRFLGVPSWIRWGMRWLGQDTEIPIPMGLERGGQVLARPFCPPYYATMSEAVAEVVAFKQGAAGIFGSQEGHAALKESNVSGRGGGKISSRAIEAAQSYAEYLYGRYGRFPVYLAPYRTTLCFQVGNVDAEFYDKHFRSGMLGTRQRARFESKGQRDQ